MEIENAFGKQARDELARHREQAQHAPTRKLLGILQRQLFSQNLSAHRLALTVGTRRLNSGRFRQEVGEYPGQLIERLRLQTGTRLLLETALPVWKIAQMLGYSDFGVFGKAMFRRKGIRPEGFRRLCSSHIADSDFLQRAADGRLDHSEVRYLLATVALLYPGAVRKARTSDLGGPGDE